MDLQFLRPLYEEPAEYVSVYLETSRDSEDAAHAVDLRWRSARERLAGAGAGPATLDAAGAVLTDPGRAAPGRAVFARDGAVRLTEPLPNPPRREIARLAQLPHVMPLLAQREPHVAHLRVMARLDGGEVLAVAGGGGEHEEQVAGTGWPVHKTGRGGWSARRYDNAAEEAWDVNAKELAEQVTAAAAGVGAELIVIGGDVQARNLLTRHLPSDLAARVTEIEAEVTADSAAAGRAADRAVTGYVANLARARFAHWSNQQAHQHGVAGLHATMAALRDGAVAELLLVDHPESTAAAWVGPDGTDLADAAAALVERGVGQPCLERADAALARAAATTGAALYFLPPDLFGTGGASEAFPASGGSEAVPPGAPAPPADGVAALLRYPTGEWNG